tara:strand:- start:762 stop:1034 length:273 start_codon:yes stop_codon:yes gene_type:complete
MDIPIILLLLLTVYVAVLLFLKNIGFKRKISSSTYNNCCPSCGSPLERVKRTQRDRLINFLSFQIFSFKRYSCGKCQWEGLLWEKKFNNV